jgi:hypothetical protein
MGQGTMYLSIPKERAATILTQNVSEYEVEDDTDDTIVVNKSWNPTVGFPKSKKCAILTNHNTGQDCKVEYYYDRVFEELQDYTL